MGGRTGVGRTGVGRTGVGSSGPPPVAAPVARRSPSSTPLAGRYAETARATLVAANRTPGDDLGRTQGLVLTVQELLLTLVVAASVHHLDPVRHLDRPAPPPASLAVVRRTAEALLGAPFDEPDDAQVALVATGCAAAPAALSSRLPLLGRRP